MKAKKILYITPGLNVGGAEKFVITLSDALAAESESQLLVSLVAHNALHSELNKSIQFITLPRKYKLDILPILKLRKLIRKEKPDVIFCVNFFSYFFLKCATIFLNVTTKRVISYHSTIHVSKKEYLLHQFYSFILNKNDKIITVSNNQAEYTAKQLGIPTSQFKTIHNGIDTQYWQPWSPSDSDGGYIRNKYNIPRDIKVIIKAAAFRKEKNHLGAVRALQALHSVHRCKAYLLLLGEGPMLDEVKNLVVELGMQDYVIFTGLQKNVRPFYLESDLFTLCSSNVETFSIAALEAMACGLPCVLTDIGGAREMIVEGTTGYLCTPEYQDIANAWHKALNADFKKEKIHEHVATNFGAAEMIKEYEKIL